MKNITPEELVKVLNNMAVLYQDDEMASNHHYKLIYSAEVQEKLGEKVIVVKSFR